MRIAKVKALAISGHRNRMFKAGDEVNENQFPEGRFDELLKESRIELTGENEVVANPPPAEVEIIRKPIDEVPAGIRQAQERKSRKKQVLPKEPEQPVVEENLEPDETKDTNLGDSVRLEMLKDLKDWKVSVNKNATKEEIYDLWKKHKKQ